MSQIRQSPNFLNSFKAYTPPNTMSATVQSYAYTRIP